MQIGVSQIDITPEPGIELCGFANRDQPSTNKLDKLFCKAVYVESEFQKIVWLQLDLIGIDRQFALRIRKWAAKIFKTVIGNIIIATTHTHSGPATIKLNYCGKISRDYLSQLTKKIKVCCNEARENLEECYACVEEAECELSIDRRGFSSANTDKKIGILVFKRKDDTPKVVLINYAMHPVCLAGSGISADFPGKVCEMIQNNLSGRPLVMFALGACGNINPPGVGVAYNQMESWGHYLAKISLEKIMQSAGNGQMKINDIKLVSRSISFDLDIMSESEVDEYAKRYRSDIKLRKEFGTNYIKAITKWRQNMLGKIRRDMKFQGGIEVSCFRVGGFYFVLVGAEIFSHFVQLLRERTKKKVFVVSCANGIEGYVPNQLAYKEGGYEVETCFFFYNSFRPKKGTLEYLLEEAIDLIDQIG